MRANVAPETQATLKAARTLRCLAKVKFHLDTRQSPEVIAWARSGAEKFGRALLGSLSCAPGFDIHLLIVSLQSEHKALLCFDLFLPDCDKDARSHIEQSFEEPIHFLFLKKGVYHIRRHRKLDGAVASQYRENREFDRGPLPLFADGLDPPLYCDGVRIEIGVNWEGPGTDDAEEDNGGIGGEVDVDEATTSNGGNEGKSDEGKTDEGRNSDGEGREREVKRGKGEGQARTEVSGGPDDSREDAAQNDIVKVADPES